MAKLSGLIGSGRLGKADQKVVDAMPEAPANTVQEPVAGVLTGAAMPALESSAPLEPAPRSESLDPGVQKQSIGELEIASIQPSPYQVRAVADSEYIETLMASIGQSGMISPVVVRALDSSTYEIIAGHHRLEACKRLGRVSVPVVIRHMTDAEAACALASDNLVRKELKEYERYKHARMLLDNEFCKTKSAVGEVLGVSRQLVGFLLAFDHYPDGAKAILELNPGILGATQANDLVDLVTKEPELVTEALSLLAAGRLLQNQIRSWVVSKLRSPSLRMPLRREIKISRPGLKTPIKLTYTDKEAKIQADGINIDKLQKLIEANLDDLLVF